MKLSEVRIKIIEPAYKLLPPKMASDQATVGMLTFGLQESLFIHQKQVGGPAHGLWQFERAGGVAGVLNHFATKKAALAVCKALDVEPNAEAVYQALMTGDDRLDAAFSRLLMYTDPLPLPPINDEEGWWQLYLRTWRPGAFKRQPIELRAKFKKNFAAATQEVKNVE